MHQRAWLTYHSGHPLRSLVVDDNRDSAISLSILLSFTGHETTTASDGEEACAALSGWGQDDDRRKSVEAGFDAHLVKPVNPDALQRILRQLFR